MNGNNATLKRREIQETTPAGDKTKQFNREDYTSTQQEFNYHPIASSSQSNLYAQETTVTINNTSQPVAKTLQNNIAEKFSEPGLQKEDSTENSNLLKMANSTKNQNPTEHNKYLEKEGETASLEEDICLSRPCPQTTMCVSVGR